MGAVSGKVFDQRTGSPLRAFQLRLLPDSRDFQVHDGAGSQAFESEGGTFLQDGIPPGPYRLVISSPGYVPSESLITVEAGGVARKEVALDPGEEIKGVVLDSRESPVPGAKVMAVLSATPVPNPEIPSEAPEAVAPDPSTWSQKTGEFRISGLESGVYRIVVHHKDYLVYVSGEVSLSSTTGSLPPEVRVALSDGARVTGALRNPNGMPIPGVEVELRGPKLRKAALADKEGRFIFRVVPPGEYFLGRSGDPGGAKKQVSIEVRPEDTEVSQDLPGDK